MGSPAINYDALAQQHGATVDYDALASQHGAKPVEDKSWWQKGKDSFNAATQGAKPGDGIIKGAIEDFGAGAGDVVRSLAHPVKTVQAMVSAVDPMVDYFAGDKARAEANAKQMPSLARVAGQVGTGEIIGAAAPLVGGAAMRGAAKVAPAVRTAAAATGAAAEDAGIGLMNKTVGTLKADFKRGANPGRGYFDSKNGPAMSMKSIAEKASDSLEATGAKLGEVYKTATYKGVLIPFDDVAQQLAKPLQKAIDLETGPGGTGNTATIKAYVAQFEPAFAKAEAAGGFTPSELFKIKRQIAENTNWADPAQFNLKSVRQQQVGAIGGILSDAIPETKALNQTYQDLTKLSERAKERANTGSRPLTAHIYKGGATILGAMAGAAEGNALAGAAAGAALDSVPFKTTLATGLVRGGRALRDIAAPADGAAVEGVSAGDMPTNGGNAKSGNPQSTPPILGNSSTKGPTKWAEDGAARVAYHVANDTAVSLSRDEIIAAAKIPKGKDLLIKASDLTPGSKAMADVVKQIKATLGATK